MAFSPRSSAVGTADQITAQRYNDLRADLLNGTASHDHSGSTDCGRQLIASSVTPGAITPELREQITRYLFVPPLAGIRGSSIVRPCGASGNPTVPMSPTTATKVTGYVLVPDDLNSGSTISIRPVLEVPSGGSAGTARLTLAVKVGQHGTQYDDDQHSATASVSFGSVNVYVGSPQVAFAPPTSGKVILSISLSRDPSHADDNAGTVEVSGWIIQYTAEC